MHKCAVVLLIGHFGLFLVANISLWRLVTQSVSHSHHTSTRACAFATRGFNEDCINVKHLYVYLGLSWTAEISSTRCVVYEREEEDYVQF